MSEMTNKTIAVVANEKNEMHKSIFDDELFDDVTSYDSNELHCGIGISMEFSYYKDKGYIKKGDSICIDDCKISEVIEELESIFGKLSCHNSANDFGLSADALVYEIPDSLTREMTSEQLLAASVVPEDDAQKRSFFEKILNAPKDKDYAVLAFDWKEQRIVFYGMYRLCPIESCMQQKVIMNLSDNTYTIKHEQQRNMNTRISEEDRVHISLASLHNAVIYWLDGKRLMKVKEKCSPELVIKAGVEVVCDDTFRGNTKVTKVILPSTLKVIGKRAFEGCVNLKYVFIPEGVTEIPRDCFKGCTSLEHVVIPDGISVIGQNAFDGCTSLKTFRFPSQLRTIDDCAFMHSGLESFCPTIAEGVKCKIFEKSFAFCDNLKTVTLTPGVQLAGEMSFLSCTNLEEVTFTEEQQGLPGAVATMLVGCNNVKNITVPYSDSGTSYNFNSTDWDISEYEHCDYNHLVSTR